MEPNNQGRIESSWPARATWIETSGIGVQCFVMMSRGPHGPRGLKLVQRERDFRNELSWPARATWIETVLCGTIGTVGVVVARAGTWIET